MELDYCVLCRSNCEDVHHLLLNCRDSVAVWSKCASLFKWHLDMSDCTNVWTRIHGLKGQQGVVGLVVTVIC